MAVDYSEVASDVYDALVEVGAQIGIIRKGAKTGPSNNPTFGAPTTYQCYALQIDMDKAVKDGVSLVEGTDAVYMVNSYGLSVIPDTSDRLDVDGDSIGYAVLNVKTKAPGGVNLYHMLQVKY